LHDQRSLAVLLLPLTGSSPCHPLSFRSFRGSPCGLCIPRGRAARQETGRNGGRAYSTNFSEAHTQVDAAFMMRSDRGSPMNSNPSNEAQRTLPASELQVIATALAGLRFGQVTIVIHDGRVIRSDRTESQRLTRADGGRHARVRTTMPDWNGPLPRCHDQSLLRDRDPRSVERGRHRSTRRRSKFVSRFQSLPPQRLAAASMGSSPDTIASLMTMTP